MNSSSPQWASLRSDLLLKIAKCLNARVDVLRCRAVCYSWRSSIRLPPKIPSPYLHLKLPFPIGPNPALHPKRRGHFLLTEATIYALQPLNKISDSWRTTKTWIIKIIESKSGKVVYKDPLFPVSLDNKIPFENACKKLPKFLNLLDYRVDEMTKVHGLVFVQQGKAPEIEFNEFKSTTIIKKVVASSILDKIGDGFVLMALHTGSKLAVWRFGDKEWKNIKGNGERSIYEDIAYHNGKFYALDNTGLVISVNPVSLEVTKLSPVMRGHPCGGQYKYLVKSLGNLFRVDKYYLDDFEMNAHYSSDSDDNCSVRLVVYELDEEKRDWVKAEGLDDQVLFIGYGVSFSVLAKGFHGCKRNCIYYDDVSFAEGDDDFPGCGIGLFDVEDGRGGPLFKFPGYSKIFWPPPTWLKSNALVFQN